MTTLLWIPYATVILTTCIVHVRAISCTFTLCSIPNFCGKGRECHSDPDTCRPECVCTDNVTHEDCRVAEVNLSNNSLVTSSRTGTTVRRGDTTVGDVSFTKSPQLQSADCLKNYTPNILSCPSGLPCLYGVCVKDNLTDNTRCECFPGATGALCSEPCCLDCGPYGECRFDMADRTQYCNCRPNYKGERCAKSIGDVSNTEAPLKQNTDCLNTYIRIDQFCPGGMPCFYGDCVNDNVTRSTRCECYPGAFGDLCSEPCCLDCGPFGECIVNMADSTQYCNCHASYSGERCETLNMIENTSNLRVQVEKETWHLWLVGVCAVVLFVLLLMTIVLSYLMWKRRVILIMKIVHFFQPYEDQDDRIWDALVLYHSDPVDEEFVLRKLYPTLEKEMGFKLNIHFKDFAVGETITNNIIDAVQNSRRTILVMSKNYVKSEFSRFEYQCAEQEMLQKKHRIIPIFLEDINEIKDAIDPTLKIILNSVTHIMWSGEDNPNELQKFWKRMELSMPKIRRDKVKQEITVWPESITIHTNDDKKHRDVINSTEYK